MWEGPKRDCYIFGCPVVPEFHVMPLLMGPVCLYTPGSVWRASPLLYLHTLKRTD